MQEEIEYRADCQHDPQYEIAPASENCHKERPNEPTNAKYSMQNLYPEVLPALVLKQFHRGDIASNIDHTAATSPHKQADSQIDKSQGKRRDHKTKPTHKDRPNKYLMECISLHKHLHQWSACHVPESPAEEDEGEIGLGLAGLRGEEGNYGAHCCYQTPVEQEC